MLRGQQPITDTIRSSSSEDPIDEHAFHFRHPVSSYGGGGTHRSVCNEAYADFNLHTVSQKAKSRQVKKIVDQIKEAGDDDQITLALRDTLRHSEIKPYADRIWGSVFSEVSVIGRRAIVGMRDIANIIATTKNKGMLSQECRAILSTLGMSVMKGDESDKKNRLQGAIIRQFLPSYSDGAARRILIKSCKKRKRLDTEELSKFCIIEKELLRCKYKPEEIELLRSWMVKNIHTRQSPMKNDMIQKRNIHGDVIKDENTQEVACIQKMLTTKCPREMHLEMLKEVNQGGFEGAKKDGRVRFLETTLRHYWPNWLVQMNDSHKHMCGCETCTTMKDLHTAMKSKRTKTNLCRNK